MTQSTKTLLSLIEDAHFTRRHIGSNAETIQHMLTEIGASSLQDLTQQIVPNNILLGRELNLPQAKSEAETLAELDAIASKNKVFRSFIGMGYHPTHTPNVILRNVLENPGWYTAYTPYQPEIAQGRLEALLNYQQLIIDLTGMEMANASLLDESTAAAEAMAMAKRCVRKNKSNLYFVDENTLPQTISVVRTRAQYFGFEIVVGAADTVSEHDVFGALFQYPGKNGQVTDFTDHIAQLHEKDAIVAVAADLLSLTLLKSPGAMGADIVLGSSQRFGVPMAYGGPHAAFFATKEQHKRAIPGRIIGVSIDAKGKQALRMALQTREQHIRREKANSNICTAQVLLANMAVFYAIYHGPRGLTNIATRTHRLTTLLATALTDAGVKLLNDSWFDTLTLAVSDLDAVVARSEAASLNLWTDADAGTVSLSISETTTPTDIADLYAVITDSVLDNDLFAMDEALLASQDSAIPAGLVRQEPFMTHPVFHRYHSETDMMRYLRMLEGRDLALNQAMISLGSCTMKLNAASEMIPVTWNHFANMHPFAPETQTAGYQELLTTLEEMLCEITGFDAISIQPNSGAQGEYAGLIAIRKYQESIGEGHRNICLIPSSAHGTNPASAQMAGLKVVVVKCDELGNVDYADMEQKSKQLADQLSCLMMTYPSTHGIYEDGVKEICDLIHRHGGQVYMDGANLNAQIGITRPADIGADVSHMNLHKSFAIPHGGGGPGMGPIGVKSHLAPFLASHVVKPVNNLPVENGAVSAAPYGSAGILPISWMYIRMLGHDGLKASTQMALLNANYLTKNLAVNFPILYKGKKDLVAHECIVDLRPIKARSGISEVDIAKRLMDYGFHAPTMSFPVAGTFMIEPTESESKEELDRFSNAMASIMAEIKQVESGVWPKDNNPLVNAPHTQEDLYSDAWDHPYSREVACFPTAHSKQFKFWPFVNRIDDVYGDRNLICSCPDISNYED